MAPDKKRRRALLKRLKARQALHARLLSKVEKAKKKLDKRSKKLLALEAEIASLEQQSKRPDAHRLGQAAAGDEGLRRVRLIYNPRAGSNGDGVPLEDIVGCLRTHGIVAEIGIKTSGKTARELAKEAADQGEEMVIVAAGDGTIEEVASQLVGSKTALGLIPTGTMNNLARALGVPLELDDACALLAMGVTRRIDLGRVVADAKPQVQYFLETSGVGLATIALPAGQAAEKGKWSLLPDALRRLFEYQPTPVTVELDGDPPFEVTSQVITISNSPLMGKNILIAPEAKMDDGLLDIGIYEGMTKPDLLGYFLTALDAKRPEDGRAKFYRAHHIRLTAAEPLDAHSDKDIIQTAPVLASPAPPASESSPAAASTRPVTSTRNQYVVEVEIIPGALSVVAGKGFALTLPVEASPAVPPVPGKV